MKLMFAAATAVLAAGAVPLSAQRPAVPASDYARAEKFLAASLQGMVTASNYMMRRRWDFFVRWLMDAEPPKEYQIK